jgi:hypothetical protein
VRKKHAETVECPPELLRFRPEDWPASDADVALMGTGQRSHFFAWLRWIHARAKFAQQNNADVDSIPDLTTRAAWRRVEDSLTTKRGQPT